MRSDSTPRRRTRSIRMDGRLEAFVELAVEMEFVFGEIEFGEKGIFLDQKIRHHPAKRIVVLGKRDELFAALEQEGDLGWQPPAFHVLVKAPEKRVGGRIFEQDFGIDAVCEAFGERCFACADGAFHDDVARFFEHGKLRLSGAEDEVDGA